MAEFIFYIIIAILVFDYILERLLDYLNSRLWSNDLPVELEGIYDAGKYRKSGSTYKNGYSATGCD